MIGIPCRGVVGLTAYALALLALTSGCAVLEDRPFDGQDEIRYGSEAKPATVDWNGCEAWAARLRSGSG
jgi:hypothetical protein